jgi:hypothetical protein
MSKKIQVLKRKSETESSDSEQTIDLIEEYAVKDKPKNLKSGSSSATSSKNPPKKSATSSKKPPPKKPVKRKVTTESDSDSDDDSDSDSDEDNEPPQKFKESLALYLKADNKKRDLAADMKKLNEEKKKHEKIILEFMGKQKTSTINVTGEGKLIRNKSETLVPLKQDHIEKALAIKLKDPKRAKDLTQYILESRDTNERINLKRTLEKKKKEKPDKAMKEMLQKEARKKKSR